MESFFLWLEELPLSLSIAESQSIWGFPFIVFLFILFLHSIGIALTAGPATMMGLRILGVARPMPLSSLRALFRFFWAGFFINVVTGALLFMMAATRTGYKPMYYAKLMDELLTITDLLEAHRGRRTRRRRPRPAAQQDISRTAKWRQGVL